MRRPLPLFLATLLLLPSPAFCWWETGHQVVARVAAAHLTPAARTRLARILDVDDSPETVSDALAVASTWADETKAQTGTGNWHYTDLTLEDHRSDLPKRCPDGNCAPDRVRFFVHDLRQHPQNAKWSELDAVRYVVHLVGDIHQPLHDISDADLGGNCELLNPPIHKAKNLHMLWDEGIIDALEMNDKQLAKSLEQQLVSMHGDAREHLAAGTALDWTWEGHELAMEDVYHKLHVPVEPAIFPTSCAQAPAAITSFKPEFDELYIDSMKPVVRQQLLRAGLRLAKLLNESL